MEVNVGYVYDGSVRAGLIKDATSVHLVGFGQFVQGHYRENWVCNLEYLTENYEEVEAVESVPKRRRFIPLRLLEILPNILRGWSIY